MRIFTLFFLSLICISCQSKSASTHDQSTVSQSLDTATFAGGCFWCVEASFEQLRGVQEAVSGYAGGDKATADYKLVSSGRTQHAETVQIYFDPKVISYETLLEVFFTAHDPTQLNRQGPDVGPQYRSAIFYHNNQQQKTAEQVMKRIAPDFPKPIVTELNPYQTFYKAEDYHQDYEANHPFDRYIVNVSRPKIDKVRKKFPELLKD
ncbi:peptide-methionine (S)-S-oxide reductase MsrA [Marinoscillum furvescens]|uniref:Peptide methionine sulfoxide reductase MsrA n=1 Tax=Marinoscillum furvescens DSM 4134 TaxID=1122208 RepID=A0A3D9L0T7_MARFU|nr:peptide-methionine (S)-S-oxide reductase MsrA [Marinoscillum furvescens]RED97063.1 peptide-methionine (S)-S-oxide reductase [Marinoscillum furvescens DSM 4134]